jgi:hypothetical protein
LDKVFEQEEKRIDEDELLADAFHIRPAAIIEVLRRIPPQDYNLLKGISPGLIWVFDRKQLFQLKRASRIPIPDCPIKDIPGGIISYAIVINLNYVLEKIPRSDNFSGFDVAVVVVAHELAHSFFYAFSSRALSVEEEEKRVNDLMVKWGFEKEVIAKKKLGKISKGYIWEGKSE